METPETERALRNVGIDNPRLKNRTKGETANAKRCERVPMIFRKSDVKV
jgi:hypothetical protein